MKKLILKTKYVKHYFSEAHQMYCYHYLPTTVDMTNREFEEFVYELAVLTEQYQPLFILSDSRKCYHTIGVEIQAWVASTVLDKWAKAGIKKYAQISAEDFYAELSWQQVLEETEKTTKIPYQVKHFQDKENAIQWLLEPSRPIR